MLPLTRPVGSVLATGMFAFALLATATGCGDEAVGADAGFATGTTQTPPTAGTQGEASTSGTTRGDEGSGAEGEGEVESSSDDGDTRFDLQTGDLPTPDPALTCATLDQFPPSSVGCEFWGIDIITWTPPWDSYGISVGNPWPQPTTVRIEDMRGPGDTLRLVHEFELAPESSELVRINGTGGVLPGEQHNIRVGKNEQGAFRVTSDRPVTAMQINPVGAAGSFVPEASLLIPSNGLGDVYWALGYDQHSLGSGIGNLFIIALEDNTRVHVNGLEIILDAFDVHRYTEPDVSGMSVRANTKVAVISGGDCVRVGSNDNWCDHVEEQLIPVSAWGNTYVGARHPQRAPDITTGPELVHWRVFAGAANTTVNFDPPVPGLGASVTIPNAGEHVEFASAENFVATSDAATPFMLVQYMSGGGVLIEPNPTMCASDDPVLSPPIGDPYMVQMVPAEQWLSDLPFLTDTSYPSDFVVVTREKGTRVHLACFGDIPDSRFQAVGSSNYEVAEVHLDLDGSGGEGSCEDGQQFITSDGRVGVYVGGVDCAASYGYPGGMGFEALWTPPAG